jgi:hypothetical protein
MGPKVPVEPTDASFVDAGPAPSIERNVWRAQTSVPADPIVSGFPSSDNERSWITRERRFRMSVPIGVTTTGGADVGGTEGGGTGEVEVETETEVEVEYIVAALSGFTMIEDTLTGSKSLKVRLVRHDNCESLQRASGVPIRPPLIPLSARIMP